MQTKLQKKTLKFITTQSWKHLYSPQNNLLSKVHIIIHEYRVREYNNRGNMQVQKGQEK